MPDIGYFPRQFHLKEYPSGHRLHGRRIYVDEWGERLTLTPQEQAAVDAADARERRRIREDAERRLRASCRIPDPRERRLRELLDELAKDAAVTLSPDLERVVARYRSNRDAATKQGYAPPVP
jgi:hypothetical protein